MISRYEFEILCSMESKRFENLPTLASECGFPVDLLESAMADLVEKKLVNNAGITEKGLEALEPYRVRRAIFIAAGFGSRMLPLTRNTPKPMVRVHGKRMIETQLDAVVAAGIKEIVIVRGYLGEEFDLLLKKYPNIQFIDNPLYDSCSSIASVMCARHLLQNAYVLEADLVLSNPSLIRKYEYQSNYLGIPVAHTDDWCYTVDEQGYFKEHMVGGNNCHLMIGISYWTAEDGCQLCKDLEEVYNRNDSGPQKYWDEVPQVFMKDHYHLWIRPCNLGDIVEIDSFRELQDIDPDYQC